MTTPHDGDGDRVRTPRERLAFGDKRRSVPGRGRDDAAIARLMLPAFRTPGYVEPRDWGYAGLLWFTAILLLRPQDQFPILNPVHLAEICAIVGIAPMLLQRFARQLPLCRLTSETVGMAIFGMVMLGTVPFSIWPGGAFAEFTDAYVKVFIVFVLMMNTLTTPKRLEHLMWLMLLCLGFVAARGVFDYARGVNLVEGGRLAGPVGGILGNPNDLALNMVTFLPVAAVIALSPRYAPTRRVAAGVIAALMLATVVFTKSRGGAVGLAVTLGVLVVLGRKVRPGFATIAIVSILVATPFMPSSFWMRMSTIVNEDEDAKYFTGSRETRRIVMQEGIDTFLERPLTGVGAGQFKNYNPPQRRERWRETHNALIQVAADTGVLGLVAFAFLILRAAIDAIATRRMLGRSKADDRWAGTLSKGDREHLYAHTVAMTAGLAGWFSCAMFASVAYSWTFYYLLALIVSARELTLSRLAAAQARAPAITDPGSARRASFSTNAAHGIA